MESRSERFLVIGASNVARHVRESLQSCGYEVVRLTAPSDGDLREALASSYQAIAVVTHDDVLALRYALTTARVQSTTPIIVTMFDHTIAARLRAVLPQSFVTSPADLAAPVLAGSCISEKLLAVRHTHGRQAEAVAVSDRGPEEVPFQPIRRPLWRSLAVRSSGLLRTPDTGTRMLVFGLAGLLAVIAADFAWLLFGGHHSAQSALLDAVRVVTTVGPAPEAHGVYAVMSALAMLVTVLLTAMFTAGLIDRILGPRLVGLVGARVLPHSGHVIVVGLGQVGLRLCRELTALGVDVVGVERNTQAPGLRLVRALRIPAVVLGHGDDRRLLERLGARRALAVAVVGSDDLDNIATAIVAQTVAPAVRVVLRAGEHGTLSDTGTLLPLGVVRDVSALAASYVVCWMEGGRPRSVVSDGNSIWVQTDCGTFLRRPVSKSVETPDNRSLRVGIGIGTVDQ
ncbi:NAD-binding protein [Rhodococcus sp. G-MC3]|uniref:NAD-binding protein n=1 Tax=Rhodococcus sp. G-MC3 TaxID=3046209 RepID=UPI0024BBCABF|nr:NAD-binding protein [Rhodococcus sp. G-MC3]MDJ0396445.1 NAD-binding protein [Rhodococcus sp. G-MC3]